MRRPNTSSHDYFPKPMKMQTENYPTPYPFPSNLNPSVIYPSNIPAHSHNNLKRHSHTTYLPADFTRQNSIIINLRQQLGTLKSEVAKLMSNDEVRQQTVSKNPPLSKEAQLVSQSRKQQVSQHRSPLRFKVYPQRSESISHDSKNNMIFNRSGKTSDQHKPQSNSTAIDKIFTDNRRFEKQLREAMARQNQLREQIGILEIKLRENRLESGANNSRYKMLYEQQIQAGEKLKGQFQNVIRSKNGEIEDLNKKIEQMEQKYGKKIKNVQNQVEELSNRNRIVEMREARVRQELIGVKQDLQKLRVVGMEYSEEKEDIGELLKETKQQHKRVLAEKDSIVSQLLRQIKLLSGKNEQQEQEQQLKGKNGENSNNVKSELKGKQKQINSLINDIKHLQHDLRTANSSRSFIKSLATLVDELNAQIILGKVKLLNERFKDPTEQTSEAEE